MSDLDAPSFSLGLDLDLEAPSFSLGLDLDPEPPLPPTNPAPDSSTNEVLEQDDHVAANFDPDLGPEPPRVLRQLRRGIGTPGPSSSAERVSEELRFHGPNGDNDDIEGFSSQEGIIGGVHPLTQYNSVCSTSKAPLHQPRILMTKSSNQSNSKKEKEKQVSHANVFASMGTKNDSLMFPKLTSSPLRRFQLIDSVSDDSCVDIDMKGKAHAADASIKARQSNYGCNAAFVEQSKGDASVSVPQNKDLWKDLCPMSSKIPTPAFDEVFEEYHSAKNKKPQNLGGKLPVSSQKGLSSQNDGRHGDPNSSLPHAHYYFFNDDPRIQELVRSRLPNFFPLGVTSSEGNRQLAASIILSSQNDGRHRDPNRSLPPAHYYFFNDDPRIQELVRSRLPNFFPLGVTSSEGNRQSAASIILNSQNDGRHRDPNSSLPPAHYYFFNDDPRIQELVRSRLPNFFPLGVTSSEGNRLSAASIIDYTCQFTNGETSKKPRTRNVNREGSSTRRKKSKGSSA